MANYKLKFRLKKTFQKNYMALRGWSVSDLTEKLGYTKQQVSQTLNGTAEPTMNFLHRLCDLTNLTAEELIETVPNK